VDTFPSKKHFSILAIIKINLRHVSLLSLLTAAGLCVLIPCFIGTAHLTQDTAAIPLEIFVSLIGVILLTPVFAPEQNREIHDLVCAKAFSIVKLFSLRAGYSLLLTSLLIVLFGLFMHTKGCEITLPLLCGTAANAAFLGGLGMLTSSLTGSTVIGYMPPLLYYALNLGMGAKLGTFYLFSMTTGHYASKIWLFLAGLLMIAASLLHQQLKRRLT
jgi:hypothetical protein